MATNGRKFTSLSPEDQWAMANGVSAPDGGGWRNQWNTNDIDNEFSTMDKRTQDFLLTQMNQGRQRVMGAQQQANNNKAINNNVWAQYGGAPAGAAFGQSGATDGYVDKGDGSDAWKLNGYLSSFGMKNPVMIGNKYYDKPVAKPTTTPGGAPLPIPTVEERMTRMGQAVQKGIDKGSIGANQMQDKFKYQVPGSSPTTPVTNPVASPKPKPMPGLINYSEFSNNG